MIELVAVLGFALGALLYVRFWIPGRSFTRILPEFTGIALLVGAIFYELLVAMTQGFYIGISVIAILIPFVGMGVSMAIGGHFSIHYLSELGAQRTGRVPSNPQ